ncbi:MAG: NUDIX domain-containing protein [Actinomycetota bacterium]|nr:NUDIX domain-containing protein [Actinomycetota bacterium]
MKVHRIPLPENFLEAAGKAPEVPAPVKDAATIVVVRDGDEGIEAYLMRRQSSMAFAPGFYVFPGGGVLPEDYDEVPWIGPDQTVWAEGWRTDEDRARALVVAAVRETFEETGVLLAGPDADTVLADTADLEPMRDALEAREVRFGDFLRERGLFLRADLVGAWAHWITPDFEPRRFDTRFFVAALPKGQNVGAMSGEADRVVWAPLTKVLASIDAGEATMMPPTIATCREVSVHSAAEIVDVSLHRTFPTIQPKLVQDGDQLFLETYLGEDVV